ncbi:MAG: polyprenyl diphosphate synthase, partial [Patescibacteria group bacterium]
QSKKYLKTTAMKQVTRTNDDGLSSQKGEMVLPKNCILPNHVALICDGNRRWARARGLSVVEGHKNGAQAIGDIARACRDFGIHTFTVWIFSSENWSRGKKEVDNILHLIEQMLDKHIEEAKKNNVRIIHLGRKDRIPQSLALKLAKAEIETKDNTKYVFNVAIDYGGHDEIVRATRRIVEDDIPSYDIDEKLFASYLDTHDQPYPYVDLLIRTSGEQRLSGLLPWQMNYAEIWWEESLLPDFTRERFVEALLDYSRRNRRFGGSNTVRKFDFQPQLVARLELDWWRSRKFADEREFAGAFVNYLKEQFGVSLSIAKEATDMFARALIKGETEGDWKGTKRLLNHFYTFLQNNVKLAFEPRFVASLELDYLKKSRGGRHRGELHGIVRTLYAELFRIPLLQASKVAHLRVLAQEQDEQAQEAVGKTKDAFHKRAEEYLTRSYEALKERVV